MFRYTFAILILLFLGAVQFYNLGEQFNCEISEEVESVVLTERDTTEDETELNEWHFIDVPAVPEKPTTSIALIQIRSFPYTFSFIESNQLVPVPPPEC